MDAGPDASRALRREALLGYSACGVLIGGLAALAGGRTLGRFLLGAFLGADAAAILALILVAVARSRVSVLRAWRWVLALALVASLVAWGGERVTIRLILLFAIAYSVVFAAAVSFTRPGRRRMLGALAGGAAAGAVGVGMIAWAEARGWWRLPWASTPRIVLLLSLVLAVSMSPIFLVTWRVVRRFGWRGLAACLVAIAIIGPPRDYLFVALRPEWMVFGPGLAPVLADAAAYVGMVGLGHAVMRWIAGPAGADPTRPARSVTTLSSPRGIPRSSPRG